MQAIDARARANELTLMAVLATVTMLFAAFTAAYLIRRTAVDFQRIDLPGILWANTAFLIASSITLEIARRKAARRWLLATLGLGLAFLVGQLIAWRSLANLGIYLPTSPHSSFFFMLTGIHGAHLLGGIAALLYATLRGKTLGLFTTYWHFVGGVWLYVLVMLTTL